MSWTPPRKYKGLRSEWRQVVDVKIPYPETAPGRSLNAIAERAGINTMLAEMEDWCENHCSREWWSSGFTSWSFAKTTEAVLFKMTFGGR